MSWTDSSDPSQTRHTYGAKQGTSTRAAYGDNIRYGGGPALKDTDDDPE
jgi:hypothetical protein